VSIRKVAIKGGQYPRLARGMKIQGSVKVEAVVAPDGSAKTVAIKGGHPLLGAGGMMLFKNGSGHRPPKKTHELIEVKFSP
jgi:Gram-negative bacterial TonB protein C-terminal